MWDKFVDFIERPAGEVAIAFALMFTGAAMYLLKIPKNDLAIDSGLTLIARALVTGTRKDATTDRSGTNANV